MIYKLDDLCSSISETYKFTNDRIYFLNTSDVLEGKITNQKLYDVKDLPGQAKKKIQNNDILYSEIRPHNKRYAIVNVANPDDYVVSTKLMVIRANNIINHKYLYYFLTSPKIVQHLQEVAESRSGTFPQITFDEIKSLAIDLPNSEVQQHIVDTIGTIDNLIEKYELIRDKINYILQKEWKSYVSKSNTFTYKLKDLVCYSNTGADAIQKAPIVDYQTKYKCVRVGDFTNNREYIDWGFCELTEDIFNQYSLKKGDVLITRTASIGLAKYISNDINAVYNNGIIRLKSNEKILPLLLYLICSTDDFIGYIKGIEAGSSTRPNMKINFLLEYSVDIPSMEEQLLIVSRLEKYILEKDNISIKLLKLNNIKKEYLNKFFG